ncbi:MAG: hypothetical protein ACFFCI_00585 [Promethearchaeota archaeon]
MPLITQRQFKILPIFISENNPFIIYNFKTDHKAECHFCKTIIHEGKLLFNKETECDLLTCDTCYKHIKEAYTNDYYSLKQLEIELTQTLIKKYDELIKLTTRYNKKRDETKALADKILKDIKETTQDYCEDEYDEKEYCKEE